MCKNLPLVTVGIPTYNRAVLLKRAIESALNQDYVNLEIIVSDNASTDGTESICHHYCNLDSRLKYIQQLTNRGAKSNFFEVLDNASGQFFMWLGDDDWIDQGYISSCVKQLVSDPTIVLVSGWPKYYRSGVKISDGKVFSLLHDVWWHRAITYYRCASQNDIIYGVMPTEMIRNIEIPHTIGGDWLMLANILSIGKAMMLPEISVHRELGGASESVKNIVNIHGLPKIQAIFPHTSIACSACIDIATGKIFRSHSLFTRSFVAVAVFFIVISERPRGRISSAFQRIKSIFNCN